MWNPDYSRFGAWDGSGCTTVLTEQSSTVCECGAFGTFTVLAELTEKPHHPPEYRWLVIIRYIGFSLSLILLLFFVIIVLRTP